MRCIHLAPCDIRRITLHRYLSHLLPRTYLHTSSRPRVRFPPRRSAQRQRPLGRKRTHCCRGQTRTPPLRSADIQQADPWIWALPPHTRLQAKCRYPTPVFRRIASPYLVTAPCRMRRFYPFVIMLLLYGMSTLYAPVTG